jgi:hypothetical protein
MATKLHLGVLEMPYADANPEGKRGKKNRKKRSGSVTTADVARFLEADYGIMEFFFEKYGDFIADTMADSYEQAIEAMSMGAPPTIDPLGAAAQKIQSRFREMLMNREMDGQVAGVPTEASKQGHSRRFKRASKKRNSRPSFIDTGLFETSFRVWKETK